jgi:DNA-binding NtrC family response regulator
MNSVPLVLLVDDQPNNLDVLVNYLTGSGLELAVATSGEEALELAAEHTPDLVLLDVMMPGLDGFAVCARLKARPASQALPIIFMSALTDTDSKVRGFGAGAVDFITKPLQREEVLARINLHLTLARQRRQLEDKNQQLESLNRELQEQIDRRQQVESALNLADAQLSTLTRQEAAHWGISAFIGQSGAITRLLDEVRSLQQAPRTNALVLGESGTGKELISRAIHYGSPRSAKPFIAVNCSAIPAELADAEFFGHTKGAYTGATSDRHGFFAQADGGTLFLDEIGDMPLSLQAKLLRVLEDGLVTPIGGRHSRQVDVRVVAATNVDIRAKVQAGQFRQDLYFRLAGYLISLPPLRERRGDVPLLVEHFLSLLGSQMGRDKPAISRSALAALAQYHYPGNVRELKNLIEYALIASRGQLIEVAHLHFLEPLQGEPLTIQVPATVGLATEDQRLPVVTGSGGDRLAASDAQAISDSDEQLLVEFAQAQGRIDNTLAQELLKVDHGRASYLLKKLHKEGRLHKQGERRWAYYTAVE